MLEAPLGLSHQKETEVSLARVHYPVLKPPRATRSDQPPRTGHHAWASNRATENLWGGGPGAQKHTHTTPGRDESHPSH